VGYQLGADIFVEHTQGLDVLVRKLIADTEENLWRQGLKSRRSHDEMNDALRLRLIK
jgi:hypothetical protein